MKPQRQLSRGQLIDDTMSGIPSILPEHRDAAIRTVCSRAADAAEARDLITMLGLTIGDEPEPRRITLDDFPAVTRMENGRPCAAGCGRRLRRAHTSAEDNPGTVKVARRGLCGPCYRKAGGR